ncbi:S8 family peptidase [Polluticoccus soli]|uniref:S8 family peptidase n=1 Tax=Polluticoccus soli TaxID=3034150 RepID=UPI0023E2E14A|nr:S8 family serine peptidase [Flavipsychrobacter sp. JY13-12]
MTTNVTPTKELNLQIQPNFERPPMASAPASTTLDGSKVINGLQPDGTTVAGIKSNESFLTAEELTTRPAYPGMLVNYNRVLSSIPASIRDTRGRNITVAVLDDGLDPIHPDFSGAYNNITDTTSGQPLAADINQHGTPVAGIIGARSASPSNGITGVAPECKLLPVRIINGADASPKYVIAGIKYAIQQGANIINISRAMPFDDELNQLITDTVNNKNIIVVAAAGDGKLMLPQYRPFPASSNACIAVGSAMPAFLSAQSASLPPVVTIFAQRWMPGTSSQNFYIQEPGSSFGCAFISGIVALMLSAGCAQNRASVMNNLRQFDTTVDNPAFVDAGQFTYKISS